LDALRAGILRFLTPDVIDYAFNAGRPRTSGTAEKGLLRLDPVAYYAAAAMCAHGRKLVDGAFERIENVSIAGSDHLERQIIIVPANFTLSHVVLLAL
jgi:hypothetical protein